MDDDDFDDEMMDLYDDPMDEDISDEMDDVEFTAHSGEFVH